MPSTRCNGADANTSLRISRAAAGVRRQLLVRREPLVGDEVLAPDRPARAGPVLEPLETGEREEAAVLRAVGADQGVGRPRATATARSGAPGHVQLQREGHRGAHGPHADAQERHVDGERLPGALAMEEGAEDPAGDGHPADGVAVTRPGLPGEVVHVGRRGPHGAAGPAPVAQEVVTAAVGLGAAFAATGPGHVDDVWVVGADVLELDVELLAHSRKLVGEEHVGRRGQPVDEVEALLGGDVDADALLPPVGVLEEHVHIAHRGHDAARGEAAHGVAALGVLDLDDLGAPVGQDGRGRRHERVLGHLQDANTFHDVCQRGSLPGCA